MEKRTVSTGNPPQIRAQIAKNDLFCGATNVYLTDRYLVKQRVSLMANGTGQSMMMSEDTYYARTPMRDALYRAKFCRGDNFTRGKRITTAMHTRKYVG